MIGGLLALAVLCSCTRAPRRPGAGALEEAGTRLLREPVPPPESAVPARRPPPPPTRPREPREAEEPQEGLAGPDFGILRSTGTTRFLPAPRQTETLAGREGTGEAWRPAPGSLGRASPAGSKGAAEAPGRGPMLPPRFEPYSGVLADGSRYLSPKRLPRIRVGDEYLPPEGSAEAPDAAGRLPPAEPPSGTLRPPVSALDAEVLDAVFSDQLDVFAYRVQIARSSGFEEVLFDETYSYLEDLDVAAEVKRSGTRLDPGPYFLRYAAIDLLNFQQPFSRPWRFLWPPRPR